MIGKISESEEDLLRHVPLHKPSESLENSPSSLSDSDYSEESSSSNTKRNKTLFSDLEINFIDQFKQKVFSDEAEFNRVFIDPLNAVSSLCVYTLKKTKKFAMVKCTVCK